MRNTKTKHPLFYLIANFAAKIGKIKKEQTKSRRHKEIMKGVAGFCLVFSYLKRETMTNRFILEKIKFCLLQKIFLFFTQFQILQITRKTLKHILSQPRRMQKYLFRLQDSHIFFPKNIQNKLNYSFCFQYVHSYPPPRLALQTDFVGGPLGLINTINV